MSSLLFENITQPVLVIDCGMTTTRGLVYLPRVPLLDLPRVTIPSIQSRIYWDAHKAVADGNPVYLDVYVQNAEIISLLLSHARKGCGVAIHPSIVECFRMDAKTLISQGVELLASCPAKYTHISGSDIVPGKWAEFCALISVPMPKVILVAAGESFKKLDQSASTAALGQMVYDCACVSSTGISLSSLFYTTVPGRLQHLASIQSVSNGPVAEAFSATLMGFLTQPVVHMRQLRQGVLLVKVGQTMVRAALVYAGKVFGYLEVPVANITLEELVKDLESFRLGWLPVEKMVMQGGFVSLCPDLPADAEGFKPMYITGAKAAWLSKHGAVLQQFGDTVSTGLWGLLNAYNDSLAK